MVGGPAGIIEPASSDPAQQPGAFSTYIRSEVTFLITLLIHRLCLEVLRLPVAGWKV